MATFTGSVERIGFTQHRCRPRLQIDGLREFRVDNFRRIVRHIISNRFIVIKIVGSFSAVMVNHCELHLVPYVSDRIHHLTHNGDGLRSKIGKVSQHDNDEYRHQSRCTDKVFHVLYAESTMVAAGIEHLIAHQGGEELGKRN